MLETPFAININQITRTVTIIKENKRVAKESSVRVKKVRYQREEESLRRRVCRAREPKSLGEVGQSEGATMGRGNPFWRKENCWGRSSLLAMEASTGKGSPGTDLAHPSWHCGEATLWSQNAESMPVLSLAIDDCE